MLELLGKIQGHKFAISHFRDGAEAPTRLAVKDLLGILIPKRLYHAAMISRIIRGAS